MGDIDGRSGGLLTALAVVLPESVKGRSSLDHHSSFGNRGEADRVVHPRKDRLGGIEADLGGIDVERSNKFDVRDVIAAELDVHEARHGIGRIGVLVVLHALK